MMKKVSQVAAKATILREMGLALPYAKSKPLKIENVTLRGPDPTNILVKIKAASLCHSDLSVINGSRKRPMPMALGHEAAGIVQEVGSAIPEDRAKPGDHVVLTFSPSCGHCIPCASGRPALCEKGAVANAAGTLIDGTMHITDTHGDQVYHHLGDSAFATHAIVSPDSLVKIPKDVPFEHAALFGCAVMTGVGAALNTSGVRLGDTVAVIGLGGVGLAALIGSYAAGASKIIAVDLSDEKLKFAKTLGATSVVNASNPDAVEIVKEISGGGVHHAIETAGVIKALESAVKMTRVGGSTTTAGLPPGGAKIGMDVATLVGQERKLLGSYMGSAVPARDIPRYMSLFQQGKLPVDKLLSEIIKLEDINEGFDKLHEGKTIRQVIKFD